MGEIMKTKILTLASVAALSLAATTAIAQPKDNRDRTPQPFVGTYAVTGEVTTISGPFGTFTCDQFQQFVPDFVCETAASVRLGSGGAVTLTFGEGTAIGDWFAIESRTIKMRTLSVGANQNGEASIWSVATREYDFDPGYDTFSGTVEIENYPIAEDPSNPGVPPNIAVSVAVNGVRFE